MIGLRYLFKCDQCPNEVESSAMPFEAQAQQFQVPRPRLPNGWTYFMELLLCEKHDVKYEITTND